MTTDRCLVCGRVFGYSSRPKFAMDGKGRVKGRVHSTCHDKKWAMYEKYLTPYVGNFAKTEWEAQMAWYLSCGPQRGSRTVTGPAGFLALQSTAAERAQTIDYWRNGPTKATEEWISEIIAAHLRLMDDFEKWRASL